MIFFARQNGLDTKVEKSRKQMKERKNRAKKIRGVKKVTLFIAVIFVRFHDVNALLTFLILPFLCRQRLQMLERLERRNEFSRSHC
jgi:hypothetical protein